MNGRGFSRHRPAGSDGHAVAQATQGLSDWRRPLLVALAGRGDEESSRRSRAAGIDLHLVRPVAPDKLRRLLRRFQAVVEDTERFGPAT